MAEKIDNAINNLIKRMDQAARKLLEENKEKLVDLAEALLEFEVLDREEIDKVMAGEKLTGTKKSRQYQALEEMAEKKKREETPPPDPGRQPPVAPVASETPVVSKPEAAGISPSAEIPPEDPQA
jgi:cell division protease FtsH